MNKFLRNQISGYTLIEVSVVILILSIVVAFGFSRFTGFKQRHNFDSKIDGIINAMQLAKHKAITEQKRVILKFDSGKLIFDTKGSVETIMDLKGLQILQNIKTIYFTSYGSASPVKITVIANGFRRNIILSIHGVFRTE